MAAAAKAKRSRTRLVSGPFFADVVSDTRSDPPIFHWIVQREGSPEILQWGQECTFDDAEREANSYLKGLAQQTSHQEGS